MFIASFSLLSTVEEKVVEANSLSFFLLSLVNDYK
jgi:hypothetical protein